MNYAQNIFIKQLIALYHFKSLIDRFVSGILDAKNTNHFTMINMKLTSLWMIDPVHLTILWITMKEFIWRFGIMKRSLYHCQFQCDE